MQSDTIECKPTMWFIGRAALMACMFLGFGIYFFYDAAIGYPQKNLEYFTYKTFVAAGELFDKEFRGKPDLWQAHVAQSRIDFPQNYRLPEQIDRNDTPWPAVLQNYDLMSATGKGWSAAWLEYSEKMQYPIEPAEHPYDHDAIREQWIAGGICMALVITALYLITRTLGRRMILTADSLTAAGRTFPIQAIARLDIRKWELKGLAFATLNHKYGDRIIRLDGLTYGGFNKDDSPNNADDLFKALLERYHGEVVDYAPQGDTVTSSNAAASATADKSADPASAPATQQSAPQTTPSTANDRSTPSA